MILPRHECIADPSASPAEKPPRRFAFETDTFAFANELVWQYQRDLLSGRMVTSKNRRSGYTHRCFVLVRAARQFFYHAKFEQGLPRLDSSGYRELVRTVLSRSPRRPSAEPERVTIPGFPSLRAFSQAEEALLKSCCGGRWRSYFLRSHWRMVFPLSRSHQERTAERLLNRTGSTEAIVHLVRFPQLTMNHGITLFARADCGGKIRFEAYDPNQPERASELYYDKASRTFLFPPNRYWAGGRVDVIEIFRGWLY